MTDSAVRPRPDHPTSAARIGWWQGLRPLLLRLHFLVGVFVGPFILIAALTGLLYTLTPQLEQVVHGRELTVTPAAGTVPLAEQIRTGQRAVPEGTLVEVRPPRDATSTTRVTFSTPEVAPDHTRTAFIDPYTGELRGVLTTYGEWLPVRSWFDSLHRSLLLGDVGRVYSELAASWLWVLALSGVAMWIARGRRRARLRRTLLPRTDGSPRGRLLSWHGSVGLWAILGLLFLSATGLTWSQFAGANVSQLRSMVDWSTPAVDTAGHRGAPVAATDLGAAAERALAGARSDGIDGAVAITPGEDGAAWTVSQVRRTWPVQQDSVAVDPTDGRIIDRVDFADWPAAAKLAEWGIDAHMGLLFGVANQVILAALALGIVCLVVWGYRMWWRRRPTRPLTPPGKQLPAHRGAVLSVALIGIGVGLLAPVLGASLLVFLAADTAWQALRPAPTPPPEH